MTLHTPGTARGARRPAKRARLFIEGTPLVSTKLSGVGTVLLETLRALDDDAYRDRYDIRVFVPADERTHLGRYSFTNVKVVSLPLPHSAFGFLSRIPLRFPIDLLLGRGVYVFPNFRNWSLARSRSITYIHDVCFVVHPEFVPPAHQRYLAQNVGRWLRRTDAVVAVSHSAADEIVQYLGVPREKVAVVVNAVNAAEFAPAAQAEVDAVREKYGLDRYFLALGSIEPRKNLVTLVRAFTETGLTDGTTLFLVGGDGWLNEGVYEAIDVAVAAGYDVRVSDRYVPTAELPALLTGSIALVQASWHEGFGLPVVEALACGAPVIASDIPALREAAGGSPAVSFFDPSDVDALRNLLVTHAAAAALPAADGAAAVGDVAAARSADPAPTVTRQWTAAAADLLAVAHRVWRR
ncbi:glycosyltransferase family 4 protein [Subtercola sp. YIM 133946]|uniref:glycosyltransferase family 4 protein n=1 Tax=Subtercola sp. YIM 133946 TaxID=3118909 RepID=UPI002F93A6CE